MASVVAAHPQLVLAGAADLNELLRERFQRDQGIAAQSTAESLLSRDDVDVVYIATPHQFHAVHVLLAQQIIPPSLRINFSISKDKRYVNKNTSDDDVVL